METPMKKNKDLVIRYNSELIEEGNIQSAKELLDDKFVNHSAPDGQNGPEALMYFFNDILRAGLSDLKVTIRHQVADTDFVTTHKFITGTHTGQLMGIPATGKAISIEVMDLLKVHQDKITDHWGVNNFSAVLGELATQ